MKISVKHILLAVACLSASVAASAQVTVGNAVKGPVKHMNAVNNGPIKSGHDQIRDNFQTYSDCNIPFARTHDASFESRYGGEHTVDISAIFPDFTKDVNDPASYDFVMTDNYLASIREAGTEVFFRLGQKIEHGKKKYHVYPPADYQKWAEICEHIIRHYNEGWADGFRWNIRYWEIWNEPDLDSRTWSGSPEQFLEFYKVAAMHLNSCFPKLMIGGPALAHDLKFAGKFLAYMQEHNVEIDFFSWHIYECKPELFTKKAAQIRSLLDEFGYKDTESILDEWNYIRNWTDEFQYSVDVMNGMKGAAFVSSVMHSCQDSPVDMLMYYDVQPSVYDGLFDYQTFAPKETYYAFYAWNKLVKLGKQLETRVEEQDIYVTAATDQRNRRGILVTRFNEDNNVVAKKRVSLKVDKLKNSEIIAHLTDSAHMYTEIPVHIENGVVELILEPQSFVYMEIR